MQPSQPRPTISAEDRLGGRHVASLSRSTRASLLVALGDDGNQAAWHEFHERYRSLIHGFARRRQLSDADADDVVQSVMTALVRSMRQFEYDPQRGRFRSYLKTLVIHETCRLHRRRKGIRTLTLAGEAEASALVDTSAVDDAWEAEWRSHHLRLAMRKIRREFSEQNVSAFRAFALGGRSAEQVAADIGISTHQIYKTKTRILARLSELVREQIEADA